MLGKTISHYKVIEKIGQGGMGEVYRATDTKLNRDVALKILPEQFASDSQRMGRFQREAEVLSSLDHPNIGQIYGIEDAGQTKALVLQLIEGPTRGKPKRSCLVTLVANRWNIRYSIC